MSDLDRPQVFLRERYYVRLTAQRYETRTREWGRWRCACTSCGKFVIDDTKPNYGAPLVCPTCGIAWETVEPNSTSPNPGDQP